MAHLYVAVTAHGYGHLAQVAPVIHALRQRLPALRVTLQGNLNPEVVRYRLPAGVEQVAHAADVALPMDNPLQVRWEQGLALYQAFEADYDRHLAHQIALLEDARPDLLLADIPWLPLDAARQLGIPAAGLCSLNWLDILQQSPVGERLPKAVTARLQSAYAGAKLFIRPAPSMAMPWLENSIAVGPIAEQRPRDPKGLRKQLGLAQDQRLILMQFGGTGTLALDPEPLARARMQLLTADPGIPASSTVSRIGGPGLGMLEVLASCDAMITKPGYGSFAEAACHGIPVLYVPRDDWPETQALIDWLRHQVPTDVIATERLARGDIVEPLETLLEQTRQSNHKPVAPTGIDQTLKHLLPWLQRSSS
ncbi:MULTISPECIES: hypothetical protein [Thiorhodovibrio]|uniref:hypothetical protein n=1 Tax=Thiorhodovibrio TaxID=61593 RepID=UPI001912F506|nr:MULTISPECIES: hypothetical protein [Thiorhodovibrio]MBK5967631.1 hypothetical protein [Thiorhodovibrio winogradskyi]WPL13064.1 hypothetical protein Thiosp_02852 [Thiorhodovibrio litoralis]